MPRLTAKQQALLKELKETKRRHWYWLNLKSFIQLEAFQGAFQQYTSSQAHVDPDKAKEGRLGRRLLYLHDAFGKAAEEAGKDLFVIAQRCEAAGIPHEIISKHVKSPLKDPNIEPTMEKLLVYLEGEKPLHVAKKELRDAIAKADSKTSHREINILAKYLAALNRIPQPPYEPSKKVRDYVRMRRRPRG